MADFINSLPTDLIVEMALNIPLNDITHLCQVNRKFNEIICDNEVFWRLRFVKDYKYQPRNYTGSWKQLYHDNLLNVYVVGMNYFGQLGLGDNQNRDNVTIIPDLKAKQVSTGLNHTAVIDINNNLLMFGNNSFGQLGLGDTINRDTPTLVPNIKAIFVSAGVNQTMVIDTNNDVYQFGNNILTPSRLFIKAKFVNVGEFHSFIIDLNNNIMFVLHNLPTVINNLNIKGKYAVAGANHSIVLDLQDNVYVSGKNIYGQLGLGDYVDRNTLTKIPNIKAKQASVSANYSALIDNDNNVITFGYNFGDNQPKILPGIKAKYIEATTNALYIIDLENNLWEYTPGIVYSYMDNELRRIYPNLKVKQFSAGGQYKIMLAQ